VLAIAASACTRGSEDVIPLDARPNAPELVGEGEYWVVPRPSGDYVLFPNRAPQSGCSMRWLSPSDAAEVFVPFEDPFREGVLRDTCTGSSYAPDGRRVSGPSSTDLEGRAYTFQDGALIPAD